jgi:hypothetical protein
MRQVEHLLDERWRRRHPLHVPCRLDAARARNGFDSCPATAEVARTSAPRAFPSSDHSHQDAATVTPGCGRRRRFPSDSPLSRGHDLRRDSHFASLIAAHRATAKRRSTRHAPRVTPTAEVRHRFRLESAVEEARKRGDAPGPGSATAVAVIVSWRIRARGREGLAIRTSSRPRRSSATRRSWRSKTASKRTAAWYRTSTTAA